MTTTDTDTLTERMAAEMYYSVYPEGRHRNEWPGSVYPDTVYEYRDLAAAVLPVVAAEMRRDAAREALDRAEHRIARLEAQTDIRGRAVAIYRERAREAEARIKAVEDVLDADEHVTKHMGTLGQCRPDVPAIAHDTIRRALESVPQPRA